MTASNNKMTNMQLELLKIFKYNLEESQLIEIKELLSKYFLEKIDNEMNQIWESKEWSDLTMANLSNQHTRTPIQK